MGFKIDVELKSYLKRSTSILLSRFLSWPIEKFESWRIKRLMNRNDNIILVYSIGKVGSSSVYKSIKDSPLVKAPIFHVHSLNEERIKEQKRYYLDSERKSIPFHLIQSSIITSQLDSYKGKITVLTLIREPLVREISSLFQDSFNFTKSMTIDKDLISNVIDEKLHDLLKELPEVSWFERELKEVFGIDIFDIDFDINKGYHINISDQVNFTLIRLENLNVNFEQISKILFDLSEPITMSPSNVSNSKFYHKDYKMISRERLLSGKEIERIINTAYINKFYPDYIQEIKEKWEKQ